ncbi:UNVERIFIED_CONTAM: hypothetical protein FKN15_003421 [Acipenser sinensis]
MERVWDRQTERQRDVEIQSGLLSHTDRHVFAALLRCTGMFTTSFILREQHDK